jgi:hypothetical protein
MRENTAAQIAAMKQQTFGTEVEMNNITRQKAAEIAAKFFGTGRFEYTAARNGYMTWSAYDQTGREWMFCRDSSIHGPDDEKCELVTPILQYGDMEMLQGLIRTLRKAGAKSCPSRGCGVHVHVGLNGLDGRNHDARTLRNLVNIMAAHESQIGRAIGISHYRTSSYCRVINPTFLKTVNQKKPQTMREMADIWYSSQGYSSGFRRTSHYNDTRYHMLNLHPGMAWILGSHDHAKPTVEFRLFQFDEETAESKGGLHAGKLKAYIQLCLAMSEMAKEVKYASPKPQQTENEKYAMRCWMLRLGFIGEEFETARDLLLRNMKGNSAWRDHVA